MKSLIFIVLFFASTFCFSTNVNTLDNMDLTDTESGVCQLLKQENGFEKAEDSVDQTIAFEVVKRKNQTDFFWTHIAGKKVIKYVVQRSVDGKNFKNISVLTTKESEIGDIFYDFDFGSEKSIQYYRLMIVSENGTTSFSKTSKV